MIELQEVSAMPFKDADRRCQYAKDYHRLRPAGGTCSAPAYIPLIPGETRLAVNVAIGERHEAARLVASVGRQTPKNFHPTPSRHNTAVRYWSRG
jgi:hypothetical protein